MAAWQPWLYNNRQQPTFTVLLRLPALAVPVLAASRSASWQQLSPATMFQYAVLRVLSSLLCPQAMMPAELSLACVELLLAGCFAAALRWLQPAAAPAPLLLLFVSTLAASLCASCIAAWLPVFSYRRVNRRILGPPYSSATGTAVMDAACPQSSSCDEQAVGGSRQLEAAAGGNRSSTQQAIAAVVRFLEKSVAAVYRLPRQTPEAANKHAPARQFFDTAAELCSDQPKADREVSDSMDDVAALSSNPERGQGHLLVQANVRALELAYDHAATSAPASVFSGLATNNSSDAQSTQEGEICTQPYNIVDSCHQQPEGGALSPATPADGQALRPSLQTLGSSSTTPFAGFLDSHGSLDLLPLDDQLHAAAAAQRTGTYGPGRRDGASSRAADAAAEADVALAMAMAAGVHARPKYRSQARRQTVTVKLTHLHPEQLPSTFLEELNASLQQDFHMRMVASAIRSGCTEIILELAACGLSASRDSLPRWLSSAAPLGVEDELEDDFFDDDFKAETGDARPRDSCHELHSRLPELLKRVVALLPGPDDSSQDARVYVGVPGERPVVACWTAQGSQPAGWAVQPDETEMALAAPHHLPSILCVQPCVLLNENAAAVGQTGTVSLNPTAQMSTQADAIVHVDVTLPTGEGWQPDWELIMLCNGRHIPYVPLGVMADSASGVAVASFQISAAQLPADALIQVMFKHASSQALGHSWPLLVLQDSDMVLELQRCATDLISDGDASTARDMLVDLGTFMQLHRALAGVHCTASALRAAAASQEANAAAAQRDTVVAATAAAARAEAASMGVSLLSFCCQAGLPTAASFLINALLQPLAAKLLQPRDASSITRQNPSQQTPASASFQPLISSFAELLQRTSRAADPPLPLLHQAVLSANPVMVSALCQAGRRYGHSLSWACECEQVAGWSALHAAAALADGGVLATAVLQEFPESRALWRRAHPMLPLSPSDVAGRCGNINQLPAPKLRILSVVYDAVCPPAQWLQARRRPAPSPSAERFQRYMADSTSTLINVVTLLSMTSLVSICAKNVMSGWVLESIAPLTWTLPYMLVAAVKWRDTAAYVRRRETLFAICSLFRSLGKFLVVLGLPANPMMAQFCRLGLDALSDILFPAIAERMHPLSALPVYALDAVVTGLMYRHVLVHDTLALSLLHAFARNGLGLALCCWLHARSQRTFAELEAARTRAKQE